MRLAARIGQGPLLTLGVLAVYLLFPTRQYYWDGVKFALNIEAPGASATALLDPNHLVYSPIGYFVWRLLAAAGIHIRALFVLQILNALFAAATINLTWHVLFRLTKSTWYSTWYSLVFAFSAAWWRFSTDADAYIPSIFFLMLAVLLLMMSRPRAVEAGIAHAMAMSLHQLALLFFPAALIGILRDTSEERTGKRARLKAAFAYALTALGVTAVAYVSAYVAKTWPASYARGFWEWITTHSEDSSFSFDLLRNTIVSLRGNIRLFLGGRFNLVQADVLSITVGVLFILFIVLLLRDILRNRKHPPGRLPDGPAPAWSAAESMSIMWVACYLIFLLFWLPQNTFYRLFYLPALIILMAGVTVRRPGFAKWLPVVCAAMFAWNFFFDIYPHSKSATNSILTFARDHQSDWTSGTVIAYSQFHTDLWTISYFNPQAFWVSLPAPTIEEVERLRSSATQSGKTIWLEATAWRAVAELPTGKSWLDQHSDPLHYMLLDTPSHKLGFYRLR